MARSCIMGPGSSLVLLLLPLLLLQQQLPSARAFVPVGSCFGGAAATAAAANAAGLGATQRRYGRVGVRGGVRYAIELQYLCSLFTLYSYSSRPIGLELLLEPGIF